MLFFTYFFKLLLIRKYYRISDYEISRFFEMWDENRIVRSTLERNGHNILQLNLDTLFL